jgi:multiple sugar transport system permease protein
MHRIGCARLDTPPHLGLIDSLTGLVVIYLTFNLALVIWMMRNFFDGVPRALEEAAWIDGCGIWSGFRLIALPLAAPGLAATRVLCFILSWNDFFYALILTRTKAMMAPVAIVNFMQYEGWGWAKSRLAEPWSCCRSWSSASSCAAILCVG